MCSQHHVILILGEWVHSCGGDSLHTMGVVTQIVVLLVRGGCSFSLWFHAHLVWLAWIGSGKIVL